MTTKLHLSATADQQVIEGMLTGGNISDVTVADQLTAEVFGCFVAEDMGYDSDAHRRTLEANNNIPVIPGRKNRKIKINYDKKIYKLRRNIEIFFGKIKENKRLSLRFEKHDSAFLGFIALAAIKIHLRPYL